MTDSPTGLPSSRPFREEPADDVPALRFRDVSFRYGAQTVLSNVNFELDQGDFASVVGPNGGGKTTLLRLALGLIQPDRGRIEVLGLPPGEARPQVGYTPQHQHVDPAFPVTATDVVLMGRLARTRPWGPFLKADREAAREALASVGLEDAAHRPFGDLSGGQRQRVLIARAVVSEPRILMLDEPTRGLDAGAEADLHDLLERLGSRMTLLVVSHDMSFVSRHVRTVVCVRRRVVTHPTGAVPDSQVEDLFGGRFRMVHHHRSTNDEDAGCPDS